ncbi:hypothetical protein E2C01_033970 [Portunus trituberculatus]|uniref:Uncharacterized protein n=1 Tax=Portunus trituberculatus TaxID=210409 RepID=A0A5B7F5N3_PORTR|nr:hypothetical protein [Portunus trituberculatus]
MATVRIPASHSSSHYSIASCGRVSICFYPHYDLYSRGAQVRWGEVRWLEVGGGRVYSGRGSEGGGTTHAPDARDWSQARRVPAHTFLARQRERRVSGCRAAAQGGGSGGAGREGGGWMEG